MAVGRRRDVGEATEDHRASRLGTTRSHASFQSTERARVRCARSRPKPNANCGGIYVIGWHRPPRIFGVKFDLGRYIVDFASHSLKIVIEIDGGQHATQHKQDADANEVSMSREGYRVLRFWNNDVLGNIDGVLEVIQSACLTTPTPAPPHKGEGSS